MAMLPRGASAKAATVGPDPCAGTWPRASHVHQMKHDAPVPNARDRNTGGDASRIAPKIVSCAGAMMITWIAQSSKMILMR